MTSPPSARTSASSSATRASRSVSATFSSVDPAAAAQILDGAGKARREMGRTSVDYRVVVAVFPLVPLSFYARASAPPGKPRDAALNVAFERPAAAGAARAAGHCCLLIRHGSRDALGSPLPDQAPRAGGPTATARVLERLLQKPDDWLGAEPRHPRRRQRVFLRHRDQSWRKRTGYPYAVPLAGVLLTIVVIVFCELAPKIYAGRNPDGVALHAAGGLPRAGAGGRAGTVAHQHHGLRFLRLFGVVRAPAVTTQTLSAE